MLRSIKLDPLEMEYLLKNQAQATPRESHECSTAPGPDGQVNQNFGLFILRQSFDISLNLKELPKHWRKKNQRVLRAEI